MLESILEEPKSSENNNYVPKRLLAAQTELVGITNWSCCFLQVKASTRLHKRVLKYRKEQTKQPCAKIY